MLTLRPRQITARDQARELYAQGKRAVIVVAPTGFGKTCLAADVIRLAQARATRTLFLAHREELVTQAASKLTECDLPHGVIMAGHAAQDWHPTQVASVQTVVRRMHRLSFRPDFIVIDECHLASAPTYRKIVEFYGSPRLMGLSATPSRLDNRSLGAAAGGLFDSMVITAGTADLIQEGFLSPFRYYAPSRPDLKGIRTVAGEYDQGQIAALMDKPAITGSVVQTWLDHAKGRQTLVFAVSVKQTDNLADEFVSHGIAAKCVSGETPKEERRRAMQDFMIGRITVLLNAQLYIEGIDCPSISCIVDAAPTKSVTRFLQRIGRGLRRHPAKNDCLIHDHAGDVFEHGLPDEPRQWSLDGAPKRAAAKEQVFPNRQCNSCYRVHAWALACPQCGTVYPVRPREVDQVDGQLEELTPEALDAQRVARRREVGMCRSLQEMISLGRARGYDPKWALMMWHRTRGKRKTVVQPTLL